MTTKVTITVAGHQVAVTTHSADGNEWVETETIAMTRTGETRDFYVHSGMALFVEEVSDAALPADMPTAIGNGELD